MVYHKEGKAKGDTPNLELTVAQRASCGSPQQSGTSRTGAFAAGAAAAIGFGLVAFATGVTKSPASHKRKAPEPTTRGATKSPASNATKSPASHKRKAP